MSNLNVSEVVSSDPLNDSVFWVFGELKDDFISLGWKDLKSFDGRIFEDFKVIDIMFTINAQDGFEYSWSSFSAIDDRRDRGFFVQTCG